MKTVAILVITWMMATLLLLWLGDFNLYVKFPNGSVMLKEQASLSQRALYSVLLGGVFSVVHAGLVWSTQKLSERGPGRTKT